MNDCRYETPMEQQSCGTDGALDRVLRLGQKPKCVPAIFIHAGAGFHSHQNEHVHLKACVAAAEMGMKFLKAGATATEAIEASLRILEDKEITNAGYGSNLSIDGTVECDATIVDHLGRSGACGAVPNIRNPISLAKLILDRSNKPLSLRRVPPNALVGEGARSFAEEYGLATFSNEYLISKNARDRFLRWQEDLKRAELKTKDSRGLSQPNMPCVPCQYDTATPPEGQRTYSAALMAGTWNEGQPNSPYAGSPTPERSSRPSDSPAGYFRGAGPSTPAASRSSARASPIGSPLNSFGVANGQKGVSPSFFHTNNPSKAESTSQLAGKDQNTFSPDMTTAAEDSSSHRSHIPHRDGSASPQLYPRSPGAVYNHHTLTQLDAGNPRGVKRPLSLGERGKLNPRARTEPFHLETGSEDVVTDTIGAIAVDNKGQIAAGSSSGGIGMKHRGRLGPAALVGIGTAVVPSDENDEDEVAVAAVTSGTGEHMATTMASQRCAERIYNGTRRGRGGGDIKDDDEDAIIESFISEDFMNHPGVRNCHSAGAIGVMVVKKTRAGYYFYFAHNTDSFALASMGGMEKEPRCTMSRLPEGAKIAQGGRKVRVD
ncbi:Fc.00g029240.m01.CDS01 [Cosmosporella sp. VM-42]